MMVRNLRLALVSLFCAAAIFALLNPAAARPSYAVITLLYTNDIHGQVLPKNGKGGLAKLATLVRRVRAEMPNVLLLDAGDFASGTPEDYYSGGRATLSAMNAISYSAAVPGNHDFDFGTESLKTAVANACFPILAANVRSAEGGDWAGTKPYQVFDLDGVRIGVIGITGMEAATTHWPGWMRDVKIEDPIKTAKALVPEVRKRADVVVVLSHLGQDADTALAKAVPGIDFIIGGHSHTPIIGWKRINGVIITQSFTFALGLGRIDFIVRLMDAGSRIVSVNGRDGYWNSLPNSPLGKTYPTLPLIPVDQAVPEDTCVCGAYMPFRVASDARLAEVIGSAEADISALRSKTGETPAENLVADAVREYAKADVAVINGDSVVAGIPKGTITVGTAFDMIDGFTSQHIVTASMTGAELKSALRNQLSGRKPPEVQISGATLDCGRPGDIATDGKVLVNGQPIDPAHIYTVAAQAYVMTWLLEDAPSAKVLAEPHVTVREVVVDYIKSRGTICPPVKS